MPITYTNRKGVIYYLHEGNTKTGKSRYYFSPSREGKLASSMPSGHEGFENVMGQVFLAKADPNPIPQKDLAVVEEKLGKLCDAIKYRVEARKGIITVHESHIDVGGVKEIMKSFFGKHVPQEGLQGLLDHSSYSPILRFIRLDSGTYEAERFCFRGGIDGWIGLSDGTGSIDKLSARFIKHLGKESFFDLM